MEFVVLLGALIVLDVLAVTLGYDSRSERVDGLRADWHSRRYP